MNCDAYIIPKFTFSILECNLRIIARWVRVLNGGKRLLRIVADVMELFPFSSDDPQTNKQKGGTLMMQYPQKSEGKELKILVQPETQHRARYLTEGSRGSVKDRSQQGFPTVKVTPKP